MEEEKKNRKLSVAVRAVWKGNGLVSVRARAYS